MMALIGFCVGMLGFFLHQIIDLIAEKKWKIASNFIDVSSDLYIP